MTLLIFIKAPVAGRVKTRLYSELAPNLAADLYRAMAQDTLNVAGLMPDVRKIIAYEPHPEYPGLEWLSGAGEWFPQQGSDLGERLLHAIDECSRRSPGPVLVIGTDLPGLSADILQVATQRLLAHDVVLGPAVDGGYYLIGVQRPHHSLFQNIPWSTSDVMAATVQALGEAKLSFSQLPMMHDLDTPQDLRRLQADPTLLSPHFRNTLEALHACCAL